MALVSYYARKKLPRPSKNSPIVASKFLELCSMAPFSGRGTSVDCVYTGHVESTKMGKWAMGKFRNLPNPSSILR